MTVSRRSFLQSLVAIAGASAFPASAISSLNDPDLENNRGFYLVSAQSAGNAPLDLEYVAVKPLAAGVRRFDDGTMVVWGETTIPGLPLKFPATFTSTPAVSVSPSAPGDLVVASASSTAVSTSGPAMVMAVGRWM